MTVSCSQCIVRCKAFLLPLPVGRLPGVGKITEEKLAKLLVQTVLELRSLDISVLEDHFGRYGVRLHERSPTVTTTVKSYRTGLRGRSPLRTPFNTMCRWQGLNQLAVAAQKSFGLLRVKNHGRHAPLFSN